MGEVGVEAGCSYVVADGHASGVDAFGGHRRVVHLPTFAVGMIGCLYGLPQNP